MKPQDLVVRCYAEFEDDVWQAICIDLNLAAQGESFEEARNKLTEQIVDYLFDALAGEDREFADRLLDRPAPLEYRLKYHWQHTTRHLTRRVQQAMCSFDLPVPMIPHRAG